MELKNRSFQYGKAALAVRTQYHQLQFVLKVVAICTDTCMSLVQIVRSLLPPDFLSADPVASVCRRSRSSAEQAQSLSGNSFLSNSFLALLPLLCLKTLISIPSSLVKNHCFLRQPNASQKCNQHYVIIRNTSCSKYANQYFPYWKILFLSSIFKKLLLRNHAVDFFEICNVCARKAIIEAATRIINSD